MECARTKKVSGLILAMLIPMILAMAGTLPAQQPQQQVDPRLEKGFIKVVLDWMEANAALQSQNQAIDKLTTDLYTVPYNAKFDSICAIYHIARPAPPAPDSTKAEKPKGKTVIKDDSEKIKKEKQK